MIPVFDLNQVHVAWLQIEGAGFVLYGFMVYSDQDSSLVEFMQRQSGLAELDQLSGDDCAIFVIESPSRKWIEYAKRHNHAWWRLFGSHLNQGTDSGEIGLSSPSVAEAVETLVRNRGSVLVVVNGEGDPRTLQQMLEPSYDTLYDRNEVWAVVRHFGISPQEVPCILFFKDIDEGDFDVICLRDITSPRQATLSFREFFSGRDFRRLVKEARRHA
jgi:hypothetical protein